MLAADIENFLAQGLDRMGLSLAGQPEALSRLSLYFHELKKWNRKVNLVARSLDDRQVLEKHFLDSLTLLAVLPAAAREQETILDVGTGGGFPGMVLKAACPGLAVTLVEPRGNRFFFLKHIGRILDAKGLNLLQIRLEKGSRARELAGQRFSLITSRAFTDMHGFVKLVAPYLLKGGRIVMMKGPGAENERLDFDGKEGGEGFRVQETRRLHLPYSKGERLLISIGKSRR
jgi:16S rRNA (guanine527-N7)-methyltransferase